MFTTTASSAYLTPYDALLCKECALDTSNLVGSGIRWLNGLTVVPIHVVLEEWGDACCEECAAPFATLAEA